MKKVKILKLALLNFKGIKQLEITFNGTTKIYGDNATGKTTLVDAFTWLLFGKDSTDRKDFSIKTFDGNNQVIHKLDHEVTGTFDIDGTETVLRRVLREKWVTRRGNETPDLQGHETLFFWNDVPLQAGEYQEKVEKIISEQTFKMITSPLYFNSLKWQDRRNILTSISGSVSDADIAATKAEFKTLMDQMGDKSFDEYKKQIAAQKKKLKDELALIPARIDEVSRNTPEAKDWKILSDEADILKHQIEGIDTQIEDASKMYEGFYSRKQQKLSLINDLKTKISNIEHNGRIAFQKQLNDKHAAIDTAKRAIENFRKKKLDDISEINRLQGVISELKDEQEKLRSIWMDVNAEQLIFNEDNFNCPACKQRLPEGEVLTKRTTLLANFNTNKEIRLKSISNQGMSINLRIEKMEAEITALRNNNYDALIEAQEDEIHKWESVKIESVQALIADNDDYKAANEKLKELEAQSAEEAPAIDNTKLKLQKSTLIDRLDAIKRQLMAREQIAQAETRKTELLNQEKEFSSQLASLEKTEFTIQEFTRTKVDLLEARINSMFRGVKFRLFDVQLNGGLVECCDTLINGVPWTDANNAARINAGIEIINVLTAYYGQSAPIWIDNSESITSIQYTDSQRIELYVSESDKQLRVA